MAETRDAMFLLKSKGFAGDGDVKMRRKCTKKVSEKHDLKKV